VKGNLFPPLIIILPWKRKEEEGEETSLKKRRKIRKMEKSLFLSFNSEVKEQGQLQKERRAEAGCVCWGE
jgi:hypothetical protein